MGRVGTGFWISAALLFVSSLFDLIVCPHSKVEESFQLQATHDLYYHGIGDAIQERYSSLLNNSTSIDLPYDHLQYPGGKLDIAARQISLFLEFLQVVFDFLAHIFCFTFFELLQLKWFLGHS
jgi:hypothetical protein